MACPHCGGNSIEYDAGQGNATCTSCGAVSIHFFFSPLSFNVVNMKLKVVFHFFPFRRMTQVLEENTIVAEISFSESGGGAASVVGTFVAEGRGT